MSEAVLTIDRGRHSTKAHLIVDGQEFAYIAPSLAVPEAPGVDPDGEPNERITYMGRHYLVGNRALATSPDAVFRTTGSKTDGPAALEVRLSLMGVLAWATSKVPDLVSRQLLVLTSAPDSEYEAAVPGLKELIGQEVAFRTGAGRFVQVDLHRDRVQVVRESIAPLWAHILTADGQYADSPLLMVLGGRPGQEELVKSKALVLGLGFRDWNVAHTIGGRRQDSRSGVRGVSEIYAALWDALRSPSIGCTLRTRADVDQVLSGKHPVWTHKDPNMLEDAIRFTISKAGRPLLDEAAQWAGSPDEYHAVLAAGGGCLMLRELVEAAFPKVIFAAQGDSARGMAYAGVRTVNAASK